MGSHFGDVTSGRIVRGGLARIERGWISSPWARIARGGVDCVAPGSHCASWPRPRAVGAGGRDSEPPPEHPGYPTSPMRPIGVGVRGAHSIYRRVGCPNLLQRPGSGRNVGRETLIFRASSRGRSRPGAPLQQIWTSPRPGSSQEPHAPHRDRDLSTVMEEAGARSPTRPIATALHPHSRRRQSVEDEFLGNHRRAGGLARRDRVCYAPFPLLRSSALRYAPFSRTAEGEGVRSRG